MADSNFAASSTGLKSRIGACVVQSAKGKLPLQECVAPRLDSQLDERRSVPTVSLRGAQHLNWDFLNFFGVMTKADARYYLRCLLSMSEEECPDIDDVEYIYEKIQSFYKGNEELVRYVNYLIRCSTHTENV